MARPKPSTDDIAHSIVETKLAIEKARLAKLEEELPKPTPQYTAYEDLPPPSPEDREKLIKRLRDLYDRINAHEDRKHREWLLSMADKWP